MPSTGVVLAGGASRRMGQDKAWLNVAGQPLWRRQLDRLAAVGATDRLVSVGTLPNTPWAGADPDVRWVSDLEPGEGPLAGVRAGLAAAREGRVLIVAVDLPALDEEFLQVLVAQSDERVGCVPCLDGHWQPLCACWPRDPARVAVEATWAAGGRSARDLARSGVEEGWMRVWEVPDRYRGNLLNWNHPADWVSGPAA